MSDVAIGPFKMQGNQVTAIFGSWKVMMDLLCDIAVNFERRTSAKDAMVAVQRIITHSRDARMKLGLYPRDLMPLEAEVTVIFHYDSEWAVVREAIYKYHIALQEMEREGVL